MYGKTPVFAFPFVDMRILFIIIVAAFPVLFFMAGERGVRIPALAWPMAGLAVAFFIGSMRIAKKNALAIYGDFVEIRASMFSGAVPIPFSRMQSVTLAKSRAVFVYNGEGGKQQTALVFGNVRFSMQDAARKALRKSLEAHGVKIG